MFFLLLYCFTGIYPEVGFLLVYTLIDLSHLGLHILHNPYNLNIILILQL